MKIIKRIYEFTVLIQIISLFIFMISLFQNNLDLSIPINFTFSDEISFGFTLKFNYISILAFLGALSILYIISSLNIVSTGMNDEGTKSVKTIIAFISQYSLLMIPISFMFSLSLILSEYIVHISLFILIIYLLNFLGGNNE